MAKNRGHNEGTISQRKDGRWEARVTIESGKHKRKCIYGKTREEVAKRLITAQSELQKGRTLADEKVTVEAFLKTWMEGTAAGRLRASTYERYKILIDKHICTHIGKIAVGRLTPQRAQKLWSDLLASGLAPRTVVQARAILRVALKQAVRHGLAPQNAAALSDAPKIKPYKAVFLNAVEAEALLAAVKGHRLESLVTLALTTGMRIGEILGLTWGDLDLKGKTLKVSQQQQRVGSKLVVCAPKTERSARSIPLTQMAVNVLEAHRAAQVELHRDDSKGELLLSGRVFVNERGAPLENGTVLRQFQKLLVDKKLARMRLHDLRHSCATLLLSRGVHPRVVMELLGHSTIAMTMNVYSHVVPEVARAAADAMEAALTTKAAASAS